MNEYPNQNHRDDNEASEELRQELMELHYGLLDEDEEAALRERINRDPQVATLWAETLVVVGKLAEAAKVTAKNVPLLVKEDDPGSESAPAKAPRPSLASQQDSGARGRYLRRWIVSLVTAASLAFIIPAVRYFNALPDKPEQPLSLAVENITGQDALSRNEFLVVLRDPKETTSQENVAYAPSMRLVPATISYQVLSKGIVLFQGTEDLSGDEPFRLKIPDEVTIPSNAKLVVVASTDADSGKDDDGSVRITVPLEPTRCLTFVSSDRPVYRPGETVYFRSVTLNRRTLASHIEVPIRYELTDPSDAAVQGAVTEGVTERGVGNGAFVIPEDAPGGTYKLIAKSLDGFFPDQECQFEVRQYRAVRLKTKLEFSKRSFAAGGRVEASLSVRRADNSVPSGADVTVKATVDSETVHQSTAKLNEQGELSVDFQLPAVIREGKGTLTLAINDGSVVETAARPIPIHTGRANVDFYPEGGYLVGGIENRVYFAARDLDGEPIEIAGEVLSQSGRIVATATTVRDGMGKFSFKPESGQRYSMRITSPKEITQTPWLPSVVEALPVLHTGTGVFDADAPLTMTLRSTRRRQTIIRAVCRGELVGVMAQEIGIGDTFIEMPIQKRARGVIRLTVLDSQQSIATPLVERLVYRQSDKRLKIDTIIDGDRDTFAPGDSVKMTIRVRNEHGQGVPGAALGVSVVDDTALSLRQKEAPSMATHFFVTSEVESPEDLEHADFYLTDAPDAKESLDLLLGTQGWRRFVSGTDDQTRESLRASLARLIDLDGQRNGLVGGIQTSDNDFQQRMRDYRRAAMTLGDRFLSSVRFALLVIGLIWFIAFLLRPRKEVVGAASLLLLGIILLVQSGCGSASNQVIMPNASDERAQDMASTPDEAMGAEMEMAMQGAQSRFADASKSEPGSKPESPMKNGKDSFAQQIVNAFMAQPGTKNQSQTIVSRVGSEQLRALSVSRGVDAADLADRIMEELRFPIRQYAHLHRASDSETRSDFTETLFWNPMMVTDSTGTAEIRFELSDSLTMYSVRVDGHTSDGRLGSGTGSITAKLPLEIEPKLPLEVSGGDRIDLPLGIALASSLRSSGNGPTSIDLKVTTDDVLKATHPSVTVSVDAGSRSTETFSLDVSDHPQTTEAMIRITADAGGGEMSDTVERSLRVAPRGFPFSQSKSGTLDASTLVKFELPEQVIEGSLSGQLRVFPSTQSQLSAGMESILREPHGCFEQTSASNYPNILAFQLMQLDGVVDKSMRLKTESLLRRGYRKLAQYECTSGGFEWFGNDPGHEALTAFGLMQFAQMSHVIDVDQAMMQRTRDWLLKRRDGKGGFHRNPRHLHSWAVNQDTVNAFVLWTLSEAQRTLPDDWELQSELTEELDRMQRVASESDDEYLIALSAAALSNFGRSAAARELMNELAGRQRSDGHLDGVETVTQSGGISRTVETTALAVLCWSDSETHHRNAVDGLNWLMKNRRQNGFGSTQATVLALKAIAAMHETIAGSDGGNVRVLADGKVIDRIKWKGRPKDGVTWTMSPSLIQKLESDPALSLTLKSSQGMSLPYTFEVTGATNSPMSDKNCAVDLNVRFEGTDQETELSAGDSADVLATVRNVTASGQPMTLAIIGLPGGMEPVIESLDKLRETGEIDFYELRGRTVVFYWRTLKSEESKEIRFPAIAQVPGRYTAPPSRAYLYYTAERKHWAQPLVAEIAGN